MEIATILATNMNKLGIPAISGPALGFPYNIIVLRGADDDNPMVLVDTRLTWVSDDEVAMDEGDVTTPGVILRNIIRPENIKIRAANVHGDVNTFQFNGMTARCILQELDRIEGKQAPDKVSKLKWELAVKKAGKAQHRSI